MRCTATILTMLLFVTAAFGQRRVDHVSIDCFGDVMEHRFEVPVVIDTEHPANKEQIESYCRKMGDSGYRELVQDLLQFKDKHRLDDWLYYQIIRRAADQLAPKTSDYTLYTLFKWHLLSLSGYDAILTYSGDKILFYVQSAENVYNIPIRKEGEKTYVCLNYHDFGNIDFNSHTFRKIDVPIPAARNAFSYSVSSIPDLKKNTSEKEFRFTYNNSEYHFKIKLNPSISTYFKNYPATDYEKHFNIPMSRDTYNSLIPALKKYIRGLNARDGVEFLMHFTRYSFLFQPDTQKYGMEKINSPEMTLLSDYSDCEDRVSLFYYLVKELYDLPMIVVVYPKHVSIAVHFDKSLGKTIEYNGRKFTICEPTPQENDLKLGESIPSLANAPYQIAFAYEPMLTRQK